LIQGQSFERVFKGQRVLVSGHTGFKGTWLSLWLAEIGAEVHGIARPPNTTPSLFEAVSSDHLSSSRLIDLAEHDRILEAISAIDPHYVFHLAAQPLVRYSYRHPIETFATNTLGTAHILEACRQTKSTRACVCVTTDKVYWNQGETTAFSEEDRLGGADPYSASKACAELVAECYRETMSSLENGLGIATARGGNVIGGGDWSEDRLVPDFARAVCENHPLTVRHPDAIRPWQHVLELSHGYLKLASALADDPHVFGGSWNFGPDSNDSVSVRELLEILSKVWASPDIRYERSDGPHEAACLRLDNTKARKNLSWKPTMHLAQAAAETAFWYKSFLHQPDRAAELTRGQINAFRRRLQGPCP
jgi:CDP-glucose 4,6-dehydratase